MTYFSIPTIRWQDIVDILIVSYIIYRIILLLRGTRAMQMLAGIFVIIVVYFISSQLDLLTLHWILQSFLSSFFLIIIIVFQNDIRRALAQMGKAPFHTTREIATKELSEIVKAASFLAKHRVGALIVLEHKTGLLDYIETGQQLDGLVTRDLLIAIFQVTSPLHDGGVVIRKGRIHSAGCLLPLSHNPYIDKQYGTRHRAALGLSEETDAVIIVVSEETQEISLVQQGKISPIRDENLLMARLQAIFHTQEHAVTWKNKLARLVGF